MSAWDDRYGSNASPVAGSSGGRRVTPGATGGVLPSGSGGIYRPTASGDAPDKQPEPGQFRINPLNPAQTIEEAGDPISQLFNGLRQAVVGTNAGRDEEGFKDKSILGETPIIGNIGRGIANVLGGAGEVVGAGINTVGGTLERLPAGDTKQLEGTYSQLPKEFRERFEKDNPIDRGVAGTGILSNEAHIYSAALRAYEQEAQFDKPSIAPGAFTAPGSIADSINNMFDILSVGAQVMAKGWSQLDTPGQGGMDRIDVIMAVGDSKTEGDGSFVFQEDKGFLNTGLLAGDPTTSLNTMEQLVYQKVKSGDWTRDDAASFLAANGQAYGHGALANIGGSVALDPINIATAGAGAIAKVGSTGARVARLAEETATAVRSAEEALSVAQKASTAAKAGTKAAKVADRAVKAATKTLDEAKVAAENATKFTSTKGVGKANIIGRAAEGSETVQKTFATLGKPYRGLEGTALGRSAKVARTIIDPLHALDLNMPSASKMLDLYSESVPRAVADTMGVHHYKGLLDEALRIDNTGGMMNAIAKDLGVASSNLGREGAVELFRAGQLNAGLGAKLMKTVPEDLVELAVKSTKQKDLEGWLRGQTLKHVQQEVWTARDKQTLARSLEQTYHIRTEAEWLKYFEKASKEQMSLLKFANYGATNRRLLDYVGNLDPKVAAKFPVPPGRMVLLARDTLTKLGAETLLNELTKAGLKQKKSLNIIRAYQEKYPSLRYITMDPANLRKSIDNFTQYLSDNLERYPMQMTDDELKALGSEADDLTSNLGEYSLGFRPKDEFLWGLERENGTGLYRAATPAWVDHVADGAISYRPAQFLRVNILGHPLVDVPVLRAAVRVVDHADSAARLMKTQVTSAMVMESARKRFIAKASTGDLAEHGVTETVAKDWFERITEYTRSHQGYSGPRGMGGNQLYRAIKEENLIPQALLNGERRLNPDDVMRLVLQAYDGDLRYIGLTQKLSGRVKTMVFEAFGVNWAGQIAEHAWPTMKFRYNPIFQLQEKVEPWVLNTQRGVSSALTGDLSAVDRATEALLQKMTNFSLVRQADLDQFEYSSNILFGGMFKKTAMKPGSALNRIQSMSKSITDVQGVKRVNMLRTFRKGLGREVRSAWDEARPGEFDQMMQHAQTKAGRLMDEDEFALQMMSENMFANDVLVTQRLGKAMGAGGLKADWANAIKTGQWHAPTDLGEVKALDLDHVATSLRLTNAKGRDIEDLTSLRQALVTEPDMMDKVMDGLARLGADKDYIRRVRNGLDFSWNGFWDTAAKRFSLTDEESSALQDMMAGAAQLRGMTPVEFMSQVFSPSLIDGTEGVLGYIEGTAAMLRQARAAGRKVKAREAKFAETRTRIAGKEGVSTREDFVRQLSKTFSAHLDPSAKRALLMEFRPEIRKAVMDGSLQFDLADLKVMWDDLAEGQLADRILGYMDGVPGTGAHAVVDDAAQGVESLRSGRDAYLRKRGVEPIGERRYYEADDALYEETAKAYSAMPAAQYEKTGRIPKVSQVNKSTTELKPRPPEVDERTYAAYRDFVTDTRNQWDHMTAPKNKGGMGIKVTVARTDPYPPTKEGRAALQADLAKDKMRVFGASSDHPLMTNEQTVMFRAVHDVFGHSAEGFQSGPRGELNAAISHAGMYSDTGRAAMLTETHGQTAYVNFSDDIIEDTGEAPFVLDAADPASDYERQFPFLSPDYEPGADYPNTLQMLIQGENWAGDRLPKDIEVAERVGPGIRESLPVDGPGGQHAILSYSGELQRSFPDIQMHHIDSPVDFHAPLDMSPNAYGMGVGTNGVTWGADDGEAITYLSPDMLGDQFDDYTKVAKTRFENSKTMNKFRYFDEAAGDFIEHARQSMPGVPWNANIGIKHVLTHEFGHVIDSRMRPYFGLHQAKALPEYQAYGDFVDIYRDSVARRYVSEYGMTSDHDMMADLFSIAFNPEVNVGDLHPEVRQAITELKQVLTDLNVYKPLKGGNPLAGQTVRQANAAKRGSVYAEQKAALLPQDLLDRFGAQFVGKGKHVESNPDVARVAQMFGKWSEGAVHNGLMKGLKGGGGIHAAILEDIGRIPTNAAVPYNFTEGAAVNLATQNMVRKWDDAFRLQYFAQQRSFLERSVNHPMFGLYPASYMWGKIMPELVRFIAAEPFGQKTGGLLYSTMDVQAAIALRREQDPTFDANIEQLGHSQALSFGGYMLPSLPWDVGASAPSWMTNIASQGLGQQKAAEEGRDVQDVSLVDAALAPIKKLDPLTTSIPWAGRAIDELNGPADEEEVQRKAAQTDKLVQASELTPYMEQVYKELQEALR